MDSKPDDWTLLIVDDNSENIRVLGNILRHHGYQIAIASSGHEALQRLPWIKPDLILLDIMMPDYDGFETCRRLKAWNQTRDIPIIFVSAIDDTDQIVRGFHLGAVDYVTKPFIKEILLARVETHLQLSQARQYLGLLNLELRRDLEKQRTLGEQDPLTGLANRRILEPRLKSELARMARQGQPVSVAMIDLDCFKQINDNFGHQVGDELLILVAQKLRENLRETDIAIRYGGDEFCLIFPETPLTAIKRSLNRIQQLLSNLSHYRESQPVTASIGAVQAFPKECWQALLGRADQAMYRAKQEGRNQVYYETENTHLIKR
ncbi:diguanylate cyclase domain-containing protein [Motiliproteus sp. MSK22-1]|uniref:diguanylate cyclase domain-containing protein n=1 Tax=Motiliproteus sp. MSK22-1 TaxID=1897630 RepID=UPI000976D44C|nr:diguanylate cyclase [Motiliproteus sp. MSK22-1]OMH29489.1 hypothetical protein BGP75_19800 [Motiliproteus sp. MSK22-1]